MMWMEWVLLAYLLPPLIRLATDYWLMSCREARDDIAQFLSQRQCIPPLRVFRPDLETKAADKAGQLVPICGGLTGAVVIWLRRFCCRLRWLIIPPLSR